MDVPVSPIWIHDPSDEARYGAAVDGRCPADGSLLSANAGATRICHCATCLRVFYGEDGRRIAQTWWSAQAGPPDPSKDELRHMLVAMLRAARPHPVEHPTMWRVWSEVCVQLGLNPNDYRIPTSDEELKKRLMLGD